MQKRNDNRPVLQIRDAIKVLQLSKLHRLVSALKKQTYRKMSQRSCIIKYRGCKGCAQVIRTKCTAQWGQLERDAYVPIKKKQFHVRGFNISPRILLIQLNILTIQLNIASLLLNKQYLAKLLIYVAKLVIFAAYFILHFHMSELSFCRIFGHFNGSLAFRYDT